MRRASQHTCRRRLLWCPSAATWCTSVDTAEQRSAFMTMPTPRLATEVPCKKCRLTVHLLLQPSTPQLLVHMHGGACTSSDTFLEQYQGTTGRETMNVEAAPPPVCVWHPSSCAQHSRHELHRKRRKRRNLLDSSSRTVQTHGGTVSLAGLQWWAHCFVAEGLGKGAALCHWHKRCRRRWCRRSHASGAVRQRTWQCQEGCQAWQAPVSAMPLRLRCSAALLADAAAAAAAAWRVPWPLQSHGSRPNAHFMLLAHRTA